MATLKITRMTSVLHARIRLGIGAKGLGLMLAPPVVALAYPFALEGFNASVLRVARSGTVLPWLGAVATFALAFAVPLIAMLAAMAVSGLAQPTTAQLRAKRVALLAVAAPTMFTFYGVVLTMLRDPLPDKLLWVSGWGFAIVSLLWSGNEVPGTTLSRSALAPLRVAHGVSALIIVMMFLALHLANHLLFPAGEATYDAVMRIFRDVYRTEIVQPLLVMLFLFQIGSGLYLVWRQAKSPSDRFRTFQIGSGVYLAFYVLGHMNSVFIFARSYLSIDTGWGFATGAPTGLIEDPWNIRLVPHYWLGVFFVLAHLAAGARVIMMAHGVSKVFADRFMISGAAAAAVIATVIMLGMSGMRVEFV